MVITPAIHQPGMVIDSPAAETSLYDSRDPDSSMDHDPSWSPTTKSKWGFLKQIVGGLSTGSTHIVYSHFKVCYHRNFSNHSRCLVFSPFPAYRGQCSIIWNPSFYMYDPRRMWCCTRSWAVHLMLLFCLVFFLLSCWI